MSKAVSRKQDDLRIAEKAGEDLCGAVANWVEALGGKPVVVGGISVEQDYERLLTFTVRVRVTGRPPDFKRFEK